MSIIEAEVEQCIKPTPIEGIVDGTAIDGACLEADFDQQRDCICTSEFKNFPASCDDFVIQFKTRWTAQVQLADSNVFQLISKLPINLVAQRRNFFVILKIKLKSIVGRIMVQMWSCQQVEKEQSGHQIDVMALLLHVIIGRRYPIAEVFMIFFSIL